MMSSTTLRLVLLVSCAHAMVHVYEMSLPSVEQQIAGEYFGDDIDQGKAFTGKLSNYWRLLWGLGALVAGWLVDRFGSRPMLTIYLIGCGAMCVFAGATNYQNHLLLAMILMGAFAAIYHPAGLAIISHETNAETRPKALGLHGIFGSLGIGTASLVAFVMIVAGFGWRQYYWALAIPGLLLGTVFFFSTLRHRKSIRQNGEPAQTKLKDDHADWTSYLILIVFAFLQGFVYSALMSFLPRYLSNLDIEALSADSANAGKIRAAGVLFLGCFGQYTAGRFARSRILEIQLATITFLNVPFLAWMAFATHWDRIVAAAMLSFVHFMQQPVYNSLVAKYSPSRRRSLCYGISFAMAFGLGGFGAMFAGHFQSDKIVYGTLAALAASGGVIAFVLWWMNRNREDPST